MQRIHEGMVRHAAHQHELTLSRRLRKRPRKTRCVETLGFFKKSSSKYTAVHFCKFSCKSVETRTIYTASSGGVESDNYRVAPTIPLLAGSVGVIPASTNDALSTARLALCEGRRGELQEGGPCHKLYLSFSYLRRLAR